jgi:hypothetical protein
VQYLLQDWAWVGLFIVNVTRRVLEAVLVGAVALALTMPDTRTFYTGSLAAWLVPSFFRLGRGSEPASAMIGCLTSCRTTW